MAKLKTVSKRIEELAHPDVEVRRKAARKLGEMGDVRAVPPLCLALCDEDIYTRKNAAYALGNLHAPDAMQPLQDALKDRREGLRGVAAWAIGQIGKHHAPSAYRAVEAIVNAAQKDKPREIHRYVGALVEMELAAASPLCVEYCSHRSAASQQCVEIALSSLLYRVKLDVTRHLLADSELSPVQVWDTLTMLEAHRPTGFFAARRFSTAQRLCEAAALSSNESEAVQQGAKRVLEYLSLGRASQFHDPNASASLLRMASGDTQYDNGDMLLRGSTSNTELPFQRLSLISKIVGAWNNMLAKLHNRFRFR